MMTLKEKRSYLIEIRERYRHAKRCEQTKILDEFCAICRYNRKYAIRLLQKPLVFKKIKRGAHKHYGPGILKVLTSIWLKSDQMCSKRLKAILPTWLPLYEQKYGKIPDAITQKLLSISPSSIDRLLRPLKVKHPSKRLCGTKPGTLLKHQIPIKTSNWDITKPGFAEADTVAHCGHSLEGDFVWSLTFTDICTGWTENRATWNKGAHGVIEQIRDIEEMLPFELLGFDSDNGSEFLNHHLWTYFVGRPKPVQFTRSRPYHKNDNAHVEQKNWSHVRQLLGYYRLDKIEIKDLLNDLYKNEWSQYQNHFCPTMKILSKERVNAKYYKKYEDPKTPYQRLLESPYISQEEKIALKKVHETLNPFDLKEQIEVKLRDVFKLAKVTSIMRQRI